MMSIEQIRNKLDEIFAELDYEVGKPPFDEAGWRICGANAHMILRFCMSLNIPCYVHHRKDILTYVAPEKTKPGQAIVNVSIWGDHCYFYGSDGDKIGTCEMNRVASRKANECPDIAYQNLNSKKEKDSDIYTSRCIEAPFRHEKTPPFSDWHSEAQLLRSMAGLVSKTVNEKETDVEHNSFDDIREELSAKKRKSKSDRENDGLLFWSTDVQDIYEQLVELQEAQKGQTSQSTLHLIMGPT